MRFKYNVIALFILFFNCSGALSQNIEIETGFGFNNLTFGTNIGDIKDLEILPLKAVAFAGQGKIKICKLHQNKSSIGELLLFFSEDILAGFVTINPNPSSDKIFKSILNIYGNNYGVALPIDNENFNSDEPLNADEIFKRSKNCDSLYAFNGCPVFMWEGKNITLLYVRVFRDSLYSPKGEIVFLIPSKNVQTLRNEAISAGNSEKLAKDTIRELLMFPLMYMSKLEPGYDSGFSDKDNNLMTVDDLNYCFHYQKPFDLMKNRKTLNIKGNVINAFPKTKFNKPALLFSGNGPMLCLLPDNISYSVFLKNFQKEGTMPRGVTGPWLSSSGVPIFVNGSSFTLSEGNIMPLGTIGTFTQQLLTIKDCTLDKRYK